jgi:hypothetical protein
MVTGYIATPHVAAGCVGHEQARTLTAVAADLNPKRLPVAPAYDHPQPVACCALTLTRCIREITHRAAQCLTAHAVGESGHYPAPHAADALGQALAASSRPTGAGPARLAPVRRSTSNPRSNVPWVKCGCTKNGGRVLGVGNRAILFLIHRLGLERAITPVTVLARARIRAPEVRLHHRRPRWSWIT